MKKYLQKSMTPNEQVTLEAKFHWIVYLLPVVVFVLFLLMAISGGKESFGAFLAVGIVLALLAMGPAFKCTMFSELAITNKKIFGKTGFIKTNEMNSPIKQIQNIAVANGLFGKIFGYGNVTVTTTSGVYSFKYVSKPNDFKNAVMTQIENSEESKMDVHAQKIADAIHNTNN